MHQKSLFARSHQGHSECIKAQMSEATNKGSRFFVALNCADLIVFSSRHICCYTVILTQTHQPMN